MTDAEAIEPQAPRLARSKAPQPPPAVIEPDAAGATKVASAPAEPLDLDPVVKDLGSFTLSKAGRAWEVVMPDRFTKAEVAFYRGDPGDRTLNAAWEGHLQINGKDVVRFRGSPRQGIFLFHDSTTGADYEEVNDYGRREPEHLLVDERLLQDQGHGAHVPGGDGHAIDLAGRFIKGGYGEARPGLCGKFERSD